MSVPFALPSQRGGKRVLRGIAAMTGAMVLTVTFAATSQKSRAAEDPGALLKKMVDTYSNSKSYTGTVISHQKGKDNTGKAITVLKTQVVKYKSPNLVNVVVTISGTGVPASQFAQGNQTVAADGKTVILYRPAQKAYIKKPDLPKLNLTDVVDVLRGMPTKTNEYMSVLPSETVKGRAVYVVMIKPAMNPKWTPDQQAKWKEMLKKATPLHLYIDKQNFALLRIMQDMNGNNLDILLENQLFNPTIPGSAFTFTLPPGSKEIVAPAQPAGGGMAPGGQGPRPGAPSPPVKR